MRTDALMVVNSRPAPTTLRLGPNGTATRMPRQRAVLALGRAVEVGATVGVLLVISQAAMPLLLHGPVRDQEPPLPVERLAYWLIYLFTAWQCVVRRRDLLRALFHNLFVPGFVAITLLSTLWSLDPTTTLRRAFALGMVTLFGTYLATRYTYAHVLRLLGVVFGAIALGSVLFRFLLPQYGIAPDMYGGAWEGVFAQKNILGNAMVLAAIVFALLTACGQRWGRVAWGGVALAASLVVLSRSVTAMVVLGVILMATPLLGLLRRRTPRSVAVFLVVCCALGAAVLIAATHGEHVLTAFGRDVTLTGRTNIWPVVWDRIMQRPLLGYGYGTFWHFSPGEFVRAAIGWDTPHAHNGYLDLLLDVGLFGFLMFVAGLVVAVRRGWASMRSASGVETLWPMLFLLVLLLSNITETAFYQSPFVWALFTAIAVGAPSASDSA